MKATMGAVLGLSISMASPVFAAGPGDGQSLQGKGFSMDDMEGSLWSPEMIQAETRKSEARQRNIERLQELINDPSYPNKADSLFRLAETHWQEAKYQYFMARQKYNDALLCYEEQRCDTEPVEPVEDQSVAIGYYRQVLQADPNYRALDQVTYFLGRASIEAGKAQKDRPLQKEGENYLKDVVSKFPNSRYVPNAHLTLAEYFFDNDSLIFAKTHYEAITTQFRNHDMHDYALYKLGWVYFNLAEFEKTISTFQRVIEAIASKKSDSGLIEFRDQALNDLIQAYAEIDNGWREARTYFIKEEGDEKAYERLDRMASLLMSKDRSDEAAELYNHLIEHDRTSPKVVEYFDALLEMHRKIGDLRETEREINRLTENFSPKGPWANRNQGDQKAIDGANELVSSSLAWLSTTYHKEAQENEQKGRTNARLKAQASDEYDKAARYYAEFLELYPNHEDAYKFNFYYAEILYDRGRYLEAADQYAKTLDKDTKGEFVEDAALGTVYAIEGELCRTGKRQCAEAGEEFQVQEVELDATLERNARVEDTAQTELDPLEARMVGAADRYVEVLSDALKDPEFKKKYPDRGAKIPNMMYIAAEIFHSHGQYREAVTRLQVIFDLFPRDEFAGYAVNLIVDAYKQLKNWVQIEKWAREVIEQRNFTTKSKADWELIIAQAKTAHARDLTAQRRYDEAIRVQQEIVSEFSSQKNLASTALYNIAIIHEEARRFPEAVSAYEDLIKRYGDSDMAVRAQAQIGYLYEAQTEFEKAAEAFVQMQKFRTTRDPEVADKAAVGYRNAGFLYRALEDYEEAFTVFDNYAKRYPKRDDVKAAILEAGRALEGIGTPAAYRRAAVYYERAANQFARQDAEFGLKARSSAALAFKKEDKVKNRRKVENLFRTVLQTWNRMNVGTVDAETKYYAAQATLEQAEYYYDDYNKLEIEAINRAGFFDMNLLRRTLTNKAEALRKTEKAFDDVLGFQSKGMAAAAAFRLGQVLYEFAESLANAPPPPGLSEDQVDEYRFALEDLYAPVQERALAAFTIAMRQAVQDNVYNKWSRLSAVYAAKVNPDEFPLADFTVKPNKTSDTVQSTSFISAVRRGSEVVDYLENRAIDQDKKALEDEDSAEPSTSQNTQEAK